MKTNAEEQEQFMRVPPSSLRVTEGWNLRMTLPGIELLAQSVSVQGVKVPLRVVPGDEKGTFLIREGHRRFAAIQYAEKHFGAKIESVPVIITRADERQLVVEALVCNSGEPMTPLERGLGYARLQEMGMTLQEIADQVGVTQGTVSKMATLAKGPERLRQMVVEGTISATQGYELLTSFDEEQLMTHLNQLEQASGGAGRKLSRQAVIDVVQIDPRKAKNSGNGNMRLEPSAGVKTRKEVQQAHRVQAEPEQMRCGASLDPKEAVEVAKRGLVAVNAVQVGRDDEAVSFSILRHTFEAEQFRDRESCQRLTTFLVLCIYAGGLIEEDDVSQWMYHGRLTEAVKAHLDTKRPL